ncbi:MAG: ATP-binding protein [Gammaproteobacteria bacterium]
MNQYDFLYKNYTRLVEGVKVTHHRYLYHTFSLEQRMTGIIGPRGVGKTTMMLQYIKEHLYEDGKAFYFSADHVYFDRLKLLELVDYLHTEEDIEYIFIDEIHKYKNWNQELKNIYDSYPDLKLVFSGSSSIDLVSESYDLTRRVKLYYLRGLSFREYLCFLHKKDYSVISYHDLISRPSKYNAVIAKIPKLQRLFKEYLAYGYYPFALEGRSAYYERISRIVDKTIYEDIANYYKLKTENLFLFKKILNFLSSIEPGKFSVHNLAKNLSVDDKTALHYVTILSDAGLVRFVSSDGQGNVYLRKPQKVFLENTNLAYALSAITGMPISNGAIRELFFLQMLNNVDIIVTYSQVGDYKIQGQVFEIGGKRKSRKQLKGEKGCVVKDDILYASGSDIPLIFFGFLY